MCGRVDRVDVVKFRHMLWALYVLMGMTHLYDHEIKSPAGILPCEGESVVGHHHSDLLGFCVNAVGRGVNWG